MAVSKRLRYEILRRDGHACRYCGATAPDATLTVDHVTPTALGGGDEPENLVTACADCNSGKAASNPDAPIVAGVTDDAIRWSAAMRRAAELQGAARDAAGAYAALFLTEWRAHYVEECREDEAAMDLPADWRDSLQRFHQAQLEGDVISRAITTTMAHETLPNSKLFRYFCGVCWRVIDERIEIARSLIDTEGEPT
jgi:hypothetical protein